MKKPKRLIAGVVAALMIACVTFAAFATVRNDEPGTAFASAVLAASEAWANGSSVNCGGAEKANVYLVYTTHASGANGRAEWTVELSHDASTWHPYGVCNDAAASQSAATNLLDEWECQLYRRVWTHDTPAGASKTQEMPPLKIDLHGAQYIRVRAREVGDTTNRGTMAGVISCGAVQPR